MSQPESIAGSEGHDQYESGRRGRGICPVLQGHIDMQLGQHISTLACLLRRH